MLILKTSGKYCPGFQQNHEKKSGEYSNSIFFAFFMNIGFLFLHNFLFFIFLCVFVVLEKIINYKFFYTGIIPCFLNITFYPSIECFSSYLSTHFFTHRNSFFVCLLTFSLNFKLIN